MYMGSRLRPRSGQPGSTPAGSAFDRRGRSGVSSSVSRPVAMSPSARHGCMAARSVDAPIASCWASPAGVRWPATSSQPVVLSSSTALRRRLRFHRRLSRSTAESASPAAALITWAWTGETPRARRTAMCPSPRCSRSVVVACQSAKWGCAGRGSAWLAAARRVQRCRRHSPLPRQVGRFRHLLGLNGHVAPKSAQGSVRTRQPRRYRILRAGVGPRVRQRSGDPIRWKPKKLAAATAGATGPTGATRSAK